MADEDDFDTDMDGGAQDDGAEVDDDDEDEETDDPAELKKRLAKAAAALKKANAQAAKLRKATKAPAKKAAPAAGGASGDADGAGRASSEQDADERFRRQAIRTEGAAAILEAGFQGDRKAARELTKLLDHDELDVDDDGEVDGLDDAVEELKERYPALFQAPQADQRGGQRRHRVPPIDSAAGRTTGRQRTQQPQSTAEKLAMALRGGR